MRLLYILLLVSLFSCTDQMKTRKIEEYNFTKTETGLKSILDSFKFYFKSTETPREKDSVIDEYNLRIFNFLSSKNIDSILVHVDTVIIDGMTITTKFHNRNNVAFQYGLTFTKPMTKFYDSLFNFMQGLKIGTDMTVNFSYMGSHHLNDPDDKSSPLLRVFAIPSVGRTKE